MGLVVAPLTTLAGAWIAGPLTTIADTTPAVFTAGLSVSGVTSSGFSVGFTVNENATVYGVAIVAGGSIPTPAQIVAGVDYSGGDVVAAFSKVVAAGVAESAQFASIVGHAGAQISAFCIAVDAAGNVQDAAAVLNAVVTLSGGTPIDTQAPLISLIGGNPYQLALGESYDEPGCTALDDIDGDVTDSVIISGAVDSLTPGQYAITYTSTDAAGNTSSRVRVVNVVAAEPIIPTYRTANWSGNSIPVVVTGDTFRATLMLMYGQSTPFDLSDAVAVKACIVAADHSSAFTVATNQQPDTLGAAWSDGHVAIILPKTITAQAAQYASKEDIAKVEVQVSLADGDDYTWYGEVLLVQGFI